MPALLKKLLPFLRWFPLRGDLLKADFMAGITVALVLIPQSMAYAQLAGLPAYYGLYAAFLPVAVAALWGSSQQLGTGPVAVVSLLTASSLAGLAAPPRLLVPGLRRDTTGRAAIWRDFVDCLRTGREPSLSLAHVRRDLELVEAVYASLADTTRRDD